MRQNSHLTSRRTFIKSAFVGLSILIIPPSRGLQPLQRTGKARFRLSLAAYSFREYFSSKATPHIDLHDFINFCADHGCDATELTSYYFPTQLTQEYLIELKRHAFLRGLAISGTAVGNNFALPDGEELRHQIQLVKEWIYRAAVMGAPHVRVFAGSTKGLSKEEAKRQCIKALEECGEHAAKYGVWLGLENHGGIVARVEDLLDIIRSVQNKWIGVNLDTGNFYETEDPYQDMEKLAPYAVNVQFKVRINWPGKGRIPTDVDRVFKILKNAGYQGYIALEYEEQDPWNQIPRWLQILREAIIKYSFS